MTMVSALAAMLLYAACAQSELMQSPTSVRAAAPRSQCDRTVTAHRR
jgi:hypothetical protein